MTFVTKRVASECLITIIIEECWWFVILVLASSLYHEWNSNPRFSSYSKVQFSLPTLPVVIWPSTDTGVVNLIWWLTLSDAQGSINSQLLAFYFPVCLPYITKTIELHSKLFLACSKKHMCVLWFIMFKRLLQKISKSALWSSLSLEEENP